MSIELNEVVNVIIVSDEPLLQNLYAVSKGVLNGKTEFFAHIKGPHTLSVIDMIVNPEAKTFGLTGQLIPTDIGFYAQDRTEWERCIWELGPDVNDTNATLDHTTFLEDIESDK